MNVHVTRGVDLLAATVRQIVLVLALEANAVGHVHRAAVFHVLFELSLVPARTRHVASVLCASARVRAEQICTYPSITELMFK